MTKIDFLNKVKVGTKIKTCGNTYVCTDAMDGFMYSFDNVDSSSDDLTFSLIGITDGSVKDIELGGDN